MQVTTSAVGIDSQRATQDHVMETSLTDRLGSWTRKGCCLSAFLLLAGSVLPLLKKSMMFGGSVWVWPWAFFSEAGQAKVAPAIATYSNGEHMEAWVWVPVACGVLALGLWCIKSVGLRCLSMSVLGAAFLIVMLSVLFQEAEIYGLGFMPPTMEGGVMTFVFLLAFACLAMANHLRKDMAESRTLRITSGLAGLVVTLSMGLFLFAGEAVWVTWPVRLLEIGILLYGVFGILSAFTRWPNPEWLGKISLLGRVILCGAFLACIGGQMTTTDPFTTFVVGSGGGFLNVFMSAVKGFAIYLGGAFLLAFGLGGIVGQLLFKRTGLCCNDER